MAETKMFHSGTVYTSAAGGKIMFAGKMEDVVL